MAIRNVVTRGYGAGASIAFVVTRGYSIGVVQVPDSFGLHYRITGTPCHVMADGERMHYRVPGGPFHVHGDD